MDNETEKETQQTETENETPKNEEETETPKTPQEETPEVEKPKQSKELQSALAQKDHWREKAEKAEKQLQSKPPESAPQGDKDEWRSKVNFLLQNQDKKYSEEEFDHIAIISTQRKISLEEAAKKENEYIQFKREKVVDKKKVPGSTSPGFSAGEKSWKDIKKIGIDAKGKDEFREYAEKMEKEETTGI